MVNVHILRLNMIAIVLIAMGATVVHAQDPSTLTRSATLADKSPTIALSLAIPKKQVPIGEIPRVTLAVTNLSIEEISFPSEFKVHVEGEKGEPPTTLYQRQITHTLRPGEQDLMRGMPEPTIEPLASLTLKFDLALLYDLSKPGKYTVYIEVLDESASPHNAGVWVRSATLTFEIVAPAK